MPYVFNNVNPSCGNSLSIRSEDVNAYMAAICLLSSTRNGMDAQKAGVALLSVEPKLVFL